MTKNGPKNTCYEYWPDKQKYLYIQKITMFNDHDEEIEDDDKINHIPYGANMLFMWYLKKKSANVNNILQMYKPW